MIEFEEIQKIWNEQKGETMYAINETALHSSVTRKKNAASKRINHVEIFVSIVNSIVATALFILAMAGHPLLFFSAGLMAATVIYIQYFRWIRKKAENTFDRSMMGELDHAISNANYIIRFNYFILVYAVAFVVITISQMIVRRDSWEEWVIVIATLLLSFFVIRKEQKVRNIPRKKQLLTLKEKLMEN